MDYTEREQLPERMYTALKICLESVHAAYMHIVMTYMHRMKKPQSEEA